MKLVNKLYLVIIDDFFHKLYQFQENLHSLQNLFYLTIYSKGSELT